MASSGRRGRGAAGRVDLALLTHERELELIRCLEELPEVVADAARTGPRTRSPPGCAAGRRFHGFYHDCPILADDVDPDLTQARSGWSRPPAIGLAIGLGLLGVAAPEAM